MGRKPLNDEERIKRRRESSAKSDKKRKELFGDSGRTLTTWRAMKQRCLSKNHCKFHRYGGRGIKICDRWMKFENFVEDMGIRPKGKTLDRIDGSLGYTKKNCRWSSYSEQNKNK